MATLLFQSFFGFTIISIFVANYVNGSLQDYSTVIPAKKNTINVDHSGGRLLNHNYRGSSSSSSSTINNENKKKKNISLDAQTSSMKGLYSYNSVLTQYTPYLSLATEFLQQQQQQHHQEPQDNLLHHRFLGDENTNTTANKSDDDSITNKENTSVQLPACGLLCLKKTFLYENVVIWQKEDGTNVTCGQMQLFFAYNSTCEYWPKTFMADIEGMCCSLPGPRYEYISNVRAKILNEETYDLTAPPLLESNKKLDVSVDINFFMVTDINVPAGSVEIFIHLHMGWNDPRLAWDNNDFDHLTRIVPVRASLDPEISEIWVPDFDLGNLINGVTSMPEAQATVYANGDVKWIRNGALKAMCWFHGAEFIPYEELGCQFIFNVLNYPERINLKFGNSLDEVSIPYQPGFYVGQGLPRFSEYRISPESARTHMSSDGGVVLYNLYFKRATKNYVRSIIVPTIILTYASFGVYLMGSEQIGERLAFALTLALVIVASQLATAGLVPNTNENIWIDTIIFISFLVVTFGIFQTFLLGYLNHVLGKQQQHYERNYEQKGETEIKEEAEAKNNDNNESEIKIPKNIDDDDKNNNNNNNMSSPPSPSPKLPHSTKICGLVSVLLTKKHIIITDRLCFYVLLAIYSIFLINMFTKVYNYEVDHDDFTNWIPFY